MSGIHKDGMGWNALGVWCGECGASTCEGCAAEFKPFQGFSEETIARLKKEQEEDKAIEEELRRIYEDDDEEDE